MKKIIWIAFAALAALWTGFVALTLQLANWVLSLIAGSQVPAPPRWAPRNGIHLPGPRPGSIRPG